MELAAVGVGGRWGGVVLRLQAVVGTALPQVHDGQQHQLDVAAAHPANMTNGGGTGLWRWEASVLRRAVEGHLKEPLIVAGDLNEGSDGPAWGLIAGRLHVLTGSAPTYPADAPVHRLDVIWGDRHVDVVAEGSIDQLVADGLARRDVVSATDHLPVWSDVEVRTG